VSGVHDRSDTKLDSLIDFHIVSVVSVQVAISKSTSRADSEERSFQSSGIVVDVVKRSSLAGLRSSEHRSHGEAISLVLAHNASKHHGSSSNGRSLLVSQLKDSALHGYILFPIETVSSTTGHGAKQEVVDFDDFAYIVARDESALSCSSIDADHHSVFELEGEGSGSLGEISDLVCG